MYVNVEGRSQTELTFLLQELEYYLYNCYDIYGSASDVQIEDQEDEEKEGANQNTHEESLRKERERRDLGGSKLTRIARGSLDSDHTEGFELRQAAMDVRQVMLTLLFCVYMYGFPFAGSIKDLCTYKDKHTVHIIIHYHHQSP